MSYALIWWVVDARKWFKGPKVNIEHQMFGRENNVIDGTDESNDSEGSSSNSIHKEARYMDEKKATSLA